MLSQSNILKAHENPTGASLKKSITKNTEFGQKYTSEKHGPVAYEMKPSDETNALTVFKISQTDSSL